MRNQVVKIAFVISILFIWIVLGESMVTAEEKLVGKTVNINTATA